MKDITIAVIGLGDMGSSHALGFDRISGCKVVAVSDLNKDWNKTRNVQWTDGVPTFYEDYHDLLAKERPDACVVAVPDYLHWEVSKAVIDAGCQLFLEKPIATNLDEADKIIKYAKQHETLMQIGLVYRYSNLYRTMAKIGREPDHPTSYMWCKEFRQCFPQKPWFFSQEKTGGTIVEKDCHHFDIFNWVIDSTPVRVFATGGQHVYKSGALVDCNYCPDEPRVMENIDTVDHAIIAIDYENGAKACLMLCMYLKPQNVMPEGLEIGALSKSGRQLVAYGDSRLSVGGAGQIFENVRIDMLADNEGIGHIGSQAQRREFIECVRTKTEPFANGKTGRDSLLIALAAEKSIKTGLPILLKDFDQ